MLTRGAGGGAPVPADLLFRDVNGQFLTNSEVPQGRSDQKKGLTSSSSILILFTSKPI
jgi:hypothetical protein